MVIDPDNINPSTWMTDNFATFSSKSFNQLTIPGSHDSGMSELHGTEANIDAIGCSTQTQGLDIYDQIVGAGCRYLDLRFCYYECNPDLSDISSGYYTAHWKDTLPGCWGGLIGRSLADVCSDLVSALSEIGKKEVIFIELSHGACLVESGAPSSLSCDQANFILSSLFNALGLSIYKGESNTDLRSITFENLIPNLGNIPGVFVWDSDGSFAINSSYNTTNGYFTSSNAPYFNSWPQSNTSIRSTFAGDIEGIVAAWPSNAQNSQLFFLAWHLTGIPAVTVLSDAAASLNPTLATTTTEWRMSGVIPNIFVPNFIAWDYVSNEDLVPLSACVTILVPPATISAPSNNSNYIPQGGNGGLRLLYINLDPVKIPPGASLQGISFILDGNQICLQLQVVQDGVFSNINGAESSNYRNAGDLYVNGNPALMPNGQDLQGFGFALANGNQLVVAPYNGTELIVPSNINNYWGDLENYYLNTNNLAFGAGVSPIGGLLFSRKNQLCVGIIVDENS